MNRKNIARSILQYASEHVVPALSSDVYKGQHGRIAIFGGCSLYCGAPYYAAHTSLRMGADLAYCFCSKGAAMPLKSYSPEWIVQAIVDEDENRLLLTDEQLSTLLERCHAVLVGPGLSRSDVMFDLARQVIRCVRSQGKPIVLDADAIHLISAEPDLIRGYQQCILTPNANEFFCLGDAILTDANSGRSVLKRSMADVDDISRCVADISDALGGVTILRKGATDIVGNASGRTYDVGRVDSAPPCLRRAGGQGDVLAGAVTTFLAWSSAIDDHRVKVDGEDTVLGLSAPVLSGYLGSMFTKAVASEAFAKHKRAVNATAMATEMVPKVFESWFPC